MEWLFLFLFLFQWVDFFVFLVQPISQQICWPQIALHVDLPGGKLSWTAFYGIQVHGESTHSTHTGQLECVKYSLTLLILHKRVQGAILVGLSCIAHGGNHVGHSSMKLCPINKMKSKRSVNDESFYMWYITHPASLRSYLCPDFPNKLGFGQISHLVKWIHPLKDTIVHFQMNFVAGCWVDLPDSFNTCHMCKAQLEMGHKFVKIKHD